MNTCDTCAWWESPKWGEGPQGHCSNLKLVDDEDAEDGLSQDTEFDNLYRYTGPKFGCVHWGPKEEAHK